MAKRYVFLVLVLAILSGCGASENVENPPWTSLQGTIQQLTSEDAGGNSGIIYRNPAFGFGCVLNENWIYADDAGLEARREAAQKTDEAADFFVDFYAYASDESASVGGIVENMGVLYGAIWDETQYLKHSLEQIESYLEVTELEYGIAQRQDISLGGTERPSVRVTGSVQDVPMYQRQVYIKHGDYMAILSITCYRVDISDAILALFFPVT